MKKAYITGTTSKNILLDCCYKLRFLGYEGISTIDAISTKDKIESIMNSSILVRLNFSSNCNKIFNFEEELANFLGILVWNEEKLNSEIANEVILRLKAEESEKQEEGEKVQNEDNQS